MPTEKTRTDSPATEAYDHGFFEGLGEGTRSSAQAVVPFLMDLLSPASVLDIGCGTGTWLAEFRRAGAAHVRGIDGPWVAPDQLEIPAGDFERVDLTALGPLEGRHDLAVCLEVAEHLPERAGQEVVAALTSSAPVVVFSAAIPGQGGIGHVNERWPDHWRAAFDAHGFELFDVVRPRVWEDERVEPWYAQNALVFADRSADPSLLARLRSAARPGFPLRVVHPRTFETAQRYLRRALRTLDADQLPDHLREWIG
ncbi:class I SAM-dependent methyltransferase [Actinoallomurus iriomotensis]|uniref:Methyltransferase domain-containing protein n=1 Tax=Actinoallomurus iriomotensis TaxID=478107 RepID=A0A9W6RGN3_9ACTN|nr:class I SAM-dependent methyltransferase [Actinoallomurus iriomotensis]GLY75484.1 hypothetical protein Airi01_037510 [Actinoallomurus iriomotensis]